MNAKLPQGDNVVYFMEANSEYRGWLEMVIKWHDLTLSLLHVQLGVGTQTLPSEGSLRVLTVR